MCGIAAIWNWSEREIPPSKLLAMAAAQKHRGPDGHGYAMWDAANRTRAPWIWRGPTETLPEVAANHLRLGLAHNWLAIQDPNPVAQQPLTLGTQRYWIVYNGEIYNFVELREELAAEGVVFTTLSDTQVLLALWQKLGPAALDRLRGMFAFILYDCEKDVLWAVRDRFGIKPLYYALLPGNAGIILASEFRGIHASGLISRKWNVLAVKAFLAAGVNKPGDTETFFQDVNELAPGCLLEIRPTQVALRRYYGLASIKCPSLAVEALPELRDCFIETIHLHLRSTREVGACLSGGLDSANIAYAIRQILGDRITNFKAFTIGMLHESDIELARLVSEQLQLRHFMVSAPAVLSVTDLVDMIMACETPNHTWGPINHYLLSRYISAEHGIPVLLDGQGGDEAFSGYPWFFATIERFITSMMSADKAASLRAAYQSKLPLPAPALNICQRMYFSRRIWVETFEDGALAALGVSPDEVLDWAPVNYYLNDEMDWSSFREHEFYRRELQHLLRQEDRLGMWFGIENRVPYLDHKLVELIGLFSPQFLLKDGFLKYPLRVLFPKLPDRLRFNVLKKGFWESYSRLPPLDHVKLAAWQDLNDLSTLIPEQRQLRALGPMARWRFFQIAVLSQVSSKEDKLVT